MTTSTGEAVLFWVLGPLMVIAALGLVFARKAVYAALSMIFVMIGLAVLYLANEAEFLGIVQIVVYTGAVMMLFVFVLMLVGVDASTSAVETIRGQRWIGGLLGIGLGALLISVISRATFAPAAGLQGANSETNPVGIARVLMSDFVFAIEVVAALLVTAALAALVLTHRRRLTRKVGQAERADARVAEDIGRLAVERGTDDEIAGIDAIRLEFESVLAEGSFDATTGERLGVLDEKLHAAIAEASHNPLLTHLNALVTVAFKQFRAHSFKVEAHAKNAISPHRKIVAALQKRDAAAAQRCMKDHMFKTLEDISLGAGK